MILSTKSSILSCTQQVPLILSTYTFFSFYRSRYVTECFPSYCSYVRLCTTLFHYYILPCPTHFTESVTKIEYPPSTVSLPLAMNEATCPGWRKTILSVRFNSSTTEYPQHRLFLVAKLLSGNNLPERLSYAITHLLNNQKTSKLSFQAIQPRLTSCRTNLRSFQADSLPPATDGATCPGWRMTLQSMCFSSFATESQQQRLLRGMTIKYMTQPTSGPGLNPWGVQSYLTTVLPASATLRRVPMHSPNTIYRNLVYIPKCSLCLFTTLTNLFRISLDTTLPIMVPKIYPPLTRYGSLH